MSMILVTGGAGFIGSHTCVELLNKGFNVCVIDSLVNSSEKIIPQIKLINEKSGNKKAKLFFRKGDLRDRPFINNVFLEFESIKLPFNSVIHFAGLKAVEESIADPLDYWDVNINSAINLLKVMDDFNCNKLVFSSSATIYDPNKKIRYNERSLKKPINPYGNTKLTIERILEDLYLSRKNKWNIVNLRYFNPVGAHSSGMLGENPKCKPTNLFPIILKVAKGEKKELSIYGNDWPTRDGTCIRDYIHVMDLADAHLAALKYLENNKPQISSFNIGTGKGTSVLEIIERFNKINSIQLPYKFQERRRGDSASVVANNKLALELLDWKPTRNMNDICFDAFKWSNYSF